MCGNKGTRGGTRRFAFEVMLTVPTICAWKKNLYVVGGEKGSFQGLIYVDFGECCLEHLHVLLSHLGTCLKMQVLICSVLDKSPSFIVSHRFLGDFNAVISWPIL